MSTQVNQLLMWGVRLPYEWSKEWEKQNRDGEDDSFYRHFEPFLEDSAYESKIDHVDGIHCAFDGRDGRFIIIGRVLAKAKEGELLGEDEPIEIKPLTDLEQELIKNSVKRNFGVDGEFRHYFFTMLH